MGSFLSRPKERENKREAVENIWFDASGNRLRPAQFPVVVCFAYVGTGFRGLSFNEGERTVCKELQEALIRVGIVPHTKNRASMNWSEASRTDTGVHAAAQVATLKIGLPGGTRVKELAELIQGELGEKSQIRVWSVISPGGGFNAQKCATSRRYYYLLPLHALSQQTKEHIDYLRNEIMSIFIGKKLFLNYTKKVVDEKSDTLYRTITEFTFGEIFEIKGEKYVLIRVCGFSFMLNQIRKMVAAVISASYGLMSADQIRESLSCVKWAIPRIPGIGLFLDEVCYDGSKIVTDFPRNSAPHSKDVHFRDVRQEIESWKHDILFVHIADVVKRTDVFRKWIKESLLQYPPVHFEDAIFLKK